MIEIKRALISTYDKTGIVDFVKVLQEFGVELLSTGGTAKLLNDAGFDVCDVSELTGFPELLGGRVKTLHPKIHGGLLAIRNDENHRKQLTQHGIGLIDLVVCNLYPFEEVVAKRNIDRKVAIEMIDIGGPTMVRAAAKNHTSVAVLTDRAQYDSVISELRENSGAISPQTSFELAKSAFARTANYDSAIANYFSAGEEDLRLHYRKDRELRYGENPHQSATFYRTTSPVEGSVAWAKQLNGKSLSYNNLLDLESTLETVRDFDRPACVITKHNNPCGLATADEPAEAFLSALECDRVSAFGSIVGFNRTVEIETATLLRNEAKSNGIKIEAIIAPSFSDEALKLLSRVKSRIILETGKLGAVDGSVQQLRYISGGLLKQEIDRAEVSLEDLEVVTKRTPSDAEFRSLLFAWKGCKHVKSNAILLAVGTGSVGIGAGQMSRVDSCRIAVQKAGDRAKGSVLASDAFFPFPDSVEIAGLAGISAIIQPGGSVNDAMSIEMADRFGMAMVFTGIRHFRHT